MRRLTRDDLPLEIRLRCFIPIEEAAEMLNISEDAFRRQYSHLIRKITRGREGCMLGDVLDAKPA